MEQDTTSLRLPTSAAPKFESLQKDVHVDVAIISAGITGLTAAVLLKSRGRRVAVIEKDRAGSGETGNTTDHKVGKADDTESSFARLQQYTTDLWSAHRRWKAVCVDGLRRIGHDVRHARGDDRRRSHHRP